jgi:hypothetical protein
MGINLSLVSNIKFYMSRMAINMLMGIAILPMPLQYPVVQAMNIGIIGGFGFMLYSDWFSIFDGKIVAAVLISMVLLIMIYRWLYFLAVLEGSHFNSELSYFESMNVYLARIYEESSRLEKMNREAQISKFNIKNLEKEKKKTKIYSLSAPKDDDFYFHLSESSSDFAMSEDSDLYKRDVHIDDDDDDDDEDEEDDGDDDDGVGDDDDNDDDDGDDDDDDDDEGEDDISEPDDYHLPSQKKSVISDTRMNSRDLNKKIEKKRLSEMVPSDNSSNFLQGIAHKKPNNSVSKAAGSYVEESPVASELTSIATSMHHSKQQIDVDEKVFVVKSEGSGDDLDNDEIFDIDFESEAESTKKNDK